MESINIESILETLQPYIEFLSLEQWAMVGAGLLVLIFLNGLRRSAKKRKALKKIAPKLNLHAFQIAPLGRDAFFKLRNDGELATLTGIAIKGRNDILIKNQVVGHKVEKEKVYSILLEASSTTKIAENFTIELSYFDQTGNNYKQAFPLSQKIAKQAKLQRK